MGTLETLESSKALCFADDTLESSVVSVSIVLALSAGTQEYWLWELSIPLCSANMPENGMSFPTYSSQIRNFGVWIDHDWPRLGMAWAVVQLRE